MNDSRSTADKNEVKDPETIIQPPVSPAPQTNPILIGIIFVLAVALVGFVAYFLGSQNPTTPSPATPTAIPVSQNNNQTPTPSADSDLEQYQSPTLSNFSFAYDPAIWSISQLPTPTSPKLILSAKDGGMLNFVYHLWYGVG